MRSEAEHEATALAMWAQYSNGDSLADVGRAFGVRAQTVHNRFSVRGWSRRNLSEARRLNGDAAGQQHLLTAFLRLRVACAAMGCDLPEIDRTLSAMDAETQAELRGLAKRDLVALLSKSTRPSSSARLADKPADNEDPFT